jgi:dTMP kinase
MDRGIFLSLDGIDGCGKSTQCRLLADELTRRGFVVTTCRDPGGTPLGDDLRQILLGHREELSLSAEMFLFMASRAQLVHEVIQPALERGDVVVSDRFLLANVVYQGHGGGFDPELLWSIGTISAAAFLPDMTLVLDLPTDLGRARRQGPADRVESRPDDYHERVRQGFLAEARRRPDVIKVIDARGSVEEVQAQIRQEVEHVLAARPRA